MSPDNADAHVWNGGDIPIGTTLLSDVGLAIVNTLLKPSETENRHLYVASRVTTQNGILAAIRETHPNSNSQLFYATWRVHWLPHGRPIKQADPASLDSFATFSSPAFTNSIESTKLMRIEIMICLGLRRCVKKNSSKLLQMP